MTAFAVVALTLLALVAFWREILGRD